MLAESLRDQDAKTLLPGVSDPATRKTDRKRNLLPLLDIGVLLAITWGWRLPYMARFPLRWDELLGALTIWDLRSFRHISPYLRFQDYMGISQEIVGWLWTQLLGPSLFSLRVGSGMLCLGDHRHRLFFDQAVTWTFLGSPGLSDGRMLQFRRRADARDRAAGLRGRCILHYRGCRRYRASSPPAGSRTLGVVRIAVRFWLVRLWNRFRSGAGQSGMACRDASLHARARLRNLGATFLSPALDSVLRSVRTNRIGGIPIPDASRSLPRQCHRRLRAHDRRGHPGLLSGLAGAGSLGSQTSAVVRLCTGRCDVDHSRVDALAYQASAGTQYAEAHANIWSGGTYSLKHRHEWAGNGRRFIERCIPLDLFGRSWEIQEGIEPPPFPPRHWWLYAFALLIVLGFIRIWWISGSRIAARGFGGEWVFLLPPILLIILLLPSWRLADDESYRYLTPFVVGWSMLMIAWLRWLISSRWAVAAIVVAYCGYCWADLHTALRYAPLNPPIPPDARVERLADQIQQMHISTVVVTRGPRTVPAHACMVEQGAIRGDRLSARRLVCTAAATP